METEIDTAKIEAAEKSLDQFINARAKGREEANELAAAERRREERQRERERLANHEAHLRNARSLKHFYRAQYLRARARESWLLSVPGYASNPRDPGPDTPLEAA